MGEKANLINATLIGKVEWYFTSPDAIIKDERGGDGKLTWKKKAFEDLKSTLARTYTDMPEAARRGIVFEKSVYENAKKEEIKGSPEFISVCRSVQNFSFYEKEGKKLSTKFGDSYIHCKYDAINRERKCVIDIKTTEKYYKGKYMETVQHLLYCYVSGCTQFTYLVAEWDQYPKIKKIHQENFWVEKDLPGSELKESILYKVESCLKALKDLDLWDLYRDKYCLY